jgi:hypothetical protein
MSLEGATLTTNHQAVRILLSDVEILRLKLAQTQLELVLAQAQVHIQRLEHVRETLVRATLMGYVAASEVEGYSIDLEAGAIVPRLAGGT